MNGVNSSVKLVPIVETTLSIDSPERAMPISVDAVKDSIIDIVVTTPEIELSASTNQAHIDIGPSGDILVLSDTKRYEGDYEVIPSRQEQILETAHKLLNKDIVVKEIPYDEVSNPSGGTTFYIGKEVEF